MLNVSKFNAYGCRYSLACIASSKCFCVSDNICVCDTITEVGICIKYNIRYSIINNKTQSTGNTNF